jgi:O-antigen/teichoic acid export membrane protein
MSGMQVESGIARGFFEAKRTNQEHVLVGTGLIIKGFGVTLWVLLSVLIFEFFIKGYDVVSWLHVFPLLIALLPIQIVGIWQLLLRLQLRPRTFVLLSTGDIITSAVFNILAVVVLGWGIPGVLWGLFLSKLLWGVVGAFFLKGCYLLVWNSGFAKDILIYSLPLVPAILTKWTQNYANRFILVALLSLAQVGLYSLAVKLASVLALVDTAFRMAWDPYALQIMGQPDSEKKYARMLNYYLVAMFGLCALVSAVGGLVVYIFTTEGYYQASSFIGFISMGLLWNGSLQILALGTIIKRQTYWNVLGFGFGGGLNLILLWFTVENWGILAAGISYLLGSVVMAIFILLVAQYLHPIPYRYKSLIVTLIVSIILPFLYYSMPDGFESLSTIGLVTLIKLGIALFVWIIYVIIVLPHNEIKQQLYKVKVLVFKEAMN